ncbi:hypothetical protein GYMLUDRAFT_76318 [Collybiopsis luxurians FD-317 M1]|uniref:DUF6699 domain-containing protein n=1 Tax=Collybiopsis luxurians FD-317 M1 TaxID=944289 RepID=A0A0D0CLE1_9AGAR|nr:hypothetical protein GYMLUDRAFT_76318 [Collybiopsis luxurians FD-317 M1]
MQSNAWGGMNFDDMPPAVELGPVPGGGGFIPPPQGARYEDTLNMSAFPGFGGEEPGRRRIPGTPHPRHAVPVGWDFQPPPPPHSAPGAFHHPNLPHPSAYNGYAPGYGHQTPYQWAGQHTPGWAYGAPPPLAPAQQEGFSSMAWRPPNFAYDERRELEYGGGGAPDSYFANPGMNDQPVAGGGFFASAGRPRSHSRQGRAHSQEYRRGDNPWASNTPGPWVGRERHWGPDREIEEGEIIDPEEQEMIHARMELMDRGHHHQVEGGGGVDWDFIDSLGGLRLEDEPHRHGRDRSRGRQPRRPALKRRGGGRATSVDEAMLAYQGFDRDQRNHRHLLRSRERERLAGLYNSYSPYSANNRLLEGQMLHEKDRITRPRDWRGDYSVKPGLLGRWSSISRHPSDVVEMYDQVKRIPSQLLQHISSSSGQPPSIFIDLRFRPNAQMQGMFPRLGRLPVGIDFAQMAAEPPSPHMRFFHPRLPWYIDVYSASALANGGPAFHYGAGAGGGAVGRGAVGLTVWEVIEGVWRELQRPITSRHFYNQEMSVVMRSSSASSPHRPLTPLSPHHGLPPPSPYGGYPGNPGPSQSITARDMVTSAFRIRCKSVGQLFGDSKRVDTGPHEAEEISKGVKKVDWLGMEGEWIWTGISRRSGGLWEIRTRRV